MQTVEFQQQTSAVGALEVTAQKAKISVVDAEDIREVKRKDRQWLVKTEEHERCYILGYN